MGGELDGVLHRLLGLLQRDHGAPQLHRAAVSEHTYSQTCQRCLTMFKSSHDNKFSLPVLVHDGEHHRDVLHVCPLQLRHEGLAVEWVVGVADGLATNQKSVST